MTENEVYEIIKNREDEHLEFKEAGGGDYSLGKVAQYAAALANEGGGKLILGVTDMQPRKIVGTGAFSGGLGKIKEKLLQEIHLRVEAFEMHMPEGRIVVFDVPPRPLGMPVCLKNVYWMRSGESLAAMTPEQIRRILNESALDFSAEICRGASLSDLDLAAVDEFRKRWSKKSAEESLLSLDYEQLLRDAELIVGNGITYSALILFGTHEALGKYLGQSEVIFEYRSNDSDIAYEQRQEWRRGFFSFYDELWNAINAHNKSEHYQDGLFILDIKAFNESAIRESILNAVSHRDYRDARSIFIRQFPERIEIESPGGLMPGITLKNILWEQSPRNRRLAEAFQRCGLVERSGQGMNRIFDSSIRECKPNPNFSDTDESHFCIILRGNIEHPEFLKVLEEVGKEKATGISVDDLIVIQQVFLGKKPDSRFDSNVEKLITWGLLERRQGRQQPRLILAQRLYSSVNEKGVHTRIQGLDRNTNKALLLKHIEDNADEGARMSELRQVLPALSRSGIQVLLRELRREGRVHSRGDRRNGRWYPGQSPCD